MNGTNRLFPRNIAGTNAGSWQFWVRAAILLWFTMKLNQTLFGFPAPWDFIKMEAVLAWQEHIKEGLLWLVQH